MMLHPGAGRLHVLLVDDDEGSRRSIERFLRDTGNEVTAVADAESALARLAAETFSVVVTDFKLPGIDGIELVRRARELGYACPCLLITAHGDVQSAVAAMRAGAIHFVEKPVSPPLLLELVREAAEKHALRLEVDRLRRQLDSRYGFSQIIGGSPAMAQVFERIRLAAPSVATVLIAGESGTGKELVARALHQNSLRRSGPFVAVNCAALPEALVESELFGHEKGAFTGALTSRKGYFEAAEKGTLFIDEIGDLPLALQPKLLRALEQRAITRVGSTRELPIDVRIVAATHQSLDSMVKEGRFRADLYFRLAVLKIDLPPLRARRDDIRVLVASFLEQLASTSQRPPFSIMPEALDAFEQYSWPGNVRELRNTVESLTVLNTSGAIGLEDLPAHILRGEEPAVEAMPEPAPAGQPPGASEEQAETGPGARFPSLAAVEQKTILKTLEACGGNRTRAAQVLGIGLRTIQRKLREYGVE